MEKELIRELAEETKNRLENLQLEYNKLDKNSENKDIITKITLYKEVIKIQEQTLKSLQTLI